MGIAVCTLETRLVIVQKDARGLGDKVFVPQLCLHLRALNGMATEEVARIKRASGGNSSPSALEDGGEKLKKFSLCLEIIIESHYSTILSRLIGEFEPTKVKHMHTKY